MDFAHMYLLFSITGTISMIFIYMYLYVNYRKQYMDIWIIGWVIHFLRISLFESGLFNYEQSFFGFTVYQILFVGCLLTLMLSIYLFCNKSMKKWIYGAIGALILGTVFNVIRLPLIYKLLPVAFYSGIACIWLGIYMLRLELTGIGKKITGYAFILWGIITIIFPFLLDTFTMWVSLSGISRIIIASGTLLVYFEKILIDLADKEALIVKAKIDRLNVVGQMAIRMAHEIRNPLTTIRGFLQIAGKRGNISNFDLIMEEIDSITTVINQYILLAGDKRVELKNCCLNSIVEALLPLMQTYANTSNVLINLDLGAVPKLYLDENEIRQLLLNLIKNGVEAMPLGGELTICTGLEQNKVILSVKDQGSGISAHILDNLGTPFLTTKDTGNTGTGLGLPTCYRIANRHNASIDIDTGNQGTTFFVYFTPDFTVA